MPRQSQLAAVLIVAQQVLPGAGADGWEKVALTNLLKCNLGSTTDTSSTVMKNFCLRDLGVFRRELQIIQPRKIVLYTGRAYDDYLEDLFPGLVGGIRGSTAVPQDD